MIIEAFRTAKFRNTIKQIAKNNNASDYKKMKFFLGTKGETKQIRINGVLIENVIAIYYTKECSGFQTSINPHAITYSDYLSFGRDALISEALGENPIQVADFRKKKVEPEALEVGRIYLIASAGRCQRTSVIRIKRTTKTTAAFEYISYRLPQNLQDKKNACLGSVNGSTEYHIECDLSELILGEAFGEGMLRASASGSWRTSAGYGASHLTTLFVEEFYYD